LFGNSRYIIINTKFSKSFGNVKNEKRKEEEKKHMEYGQEAER
jgi:hypothetical protein